MNVGVCTVKEVHTFCHSLLACSFKLHALKLARFLKNIEAAYATTIPYHNAMHACDVLQVSPAMSKQTLIYVCTINSLVALKLLALGAAKQVGCNRELPILSCAE